MPASISHVAQDVVERIRNCLARAHHDNANEHEARAAMRMASQIMDGHNINQAQVMGEESVAERAKRGGFSAVIIKPVKEGSVVKFQVWAQDLRIAMCEFFKCRTYSSQNKSRVKHTFYSIAARAFEMMHDLI